jgi:hypothetical protein
VGARNKGAGEKAAAALAAQRIDARFIAIDVADYASIEAAAATITSGFGHLDIVVKPEEQRINGRKRCISRMPLLHRPSLTKPARRFWHKLKWW